jgi:soluble lytic murein transglycosylase-like protein
MNTPLTRTMKVATIALAALVATGVAQASSIQTDLAQAAHTHGVPAALVRSVAFVESGNRCGVSNGGAHGIMQVKPATARGVGVTGNLHDCATGIRAGVRVLKQALQISGGDWCVAASLFNSGFGGPRRCSAYGRKVVSHAR